MPTSGHLAQQVGFNPNSSEQHHLWCTYAHKPVVWLRLHGLYTDRAAPVWAGLLKLQQALEALLVNFSAGLAWQLRLAAAGLCWKASG